MSREVSDRSSPLASDPDALPTAASPPDPPKYRTDIDGLRAIAVLVVVAFHAFPDRLPGGFVGVDIFFVISGFLITGILLGSLERGRFSLRDFYSRRVRRIFPALIVTMAACWIFGWFALFPDEYRQLGRHVVGGAAFVANFYYWGEAGYFDNAAVTKPLLHLWSLGIEEQFYIVWPLLLFLTHRFRIGVLRWMPALALLSFAVNVAFLDRFPTATFYSPASRAWELAIGGLLACLVAKRIDLFGREPGGASPGGEVLGTVPELSRRRSARRSLASIAGLVLLGLAVVLLEEGRDFPGWWALLPTVGTALILAAGSGAWANRVLLSNRAMVWIGLISYPLYLWHWPLLSFARIVESKTPSLGIRVAAVAASFVLATLTYRLVEKPFRFGGNARRKVATLAAAMVLVWAAGRITSAQRGLPGRAAVRTQMDHQRALLLPDDDANAEACKKRYGFEEHWELCLLDRVEAPPTVALVGDSHAHALVAGLTEFYRARGGNLLYLGTRLPFWGVEEVDFLKDDDYQRITNRMLDLALETDSVRTVILATKMKLDRRAESGRFIVEAMKRTIRRFVDAGKQVILVKDVPNLDFEPRECIRRAAIASSSTKVPCAMQREDHDALVARNDAIVASLLREFPTVELFDSPKFLCDETYCWAILDGKLLYRDRDHLSVDGDLFIGRKFAEEWASGGLKAARDAAVSVRGDDSTADERAVARGKRTPHRRRHAPAPGGGPER